MRLEAILGAFSFTLLFMRFYAESLSQNVLERVDLMICVNE